MLIENSSCAREETLAQNLLRQIHMDRNPIHVPRAGEIFANHHRTVSWLVTVGQLPEMPWLKSEKSQPLTAGHREDLSSRGWKRYQPVQSHEAPHTTSRRPGILVADDDVGVRGLLNEVLSRHGFIVWLAGNGAQALELYQELRADIDLVLLDMQMPELDGPHTLAALRQLNPEICCCFMSADIGKYTEEELLERGAVRVFQKPFQLTEIARLLWRLVNPSGTEAACSEAHGTPEGTCRNCS